MIIKFKINLFINISRKDFNVAFLKCNIGTNVFFTSRASGKLSFSPRSNIQVVPINKVGRIEKMITQNTPPWSSPTKPEKSALGTRLQKYFLTWLVPSRLSASRKLFYFINESQRSRGGRKGWREREKREIQIQMTGNESVSLLP